MPQADQAHAAAYLPFDFGLTGEQEARAEKLHRDSVVVDLLAQHVGGSEIFEQLTPDLQKELQTAMAADIPEWELLTDAEYWLYEMSGQGKTHLIRDWYFASGLTCGTYGIGVHDGHDILTRKLDSANEILARLPWLKCATTAGEIRQAKRDGKIALYAHWQPVSPIPRSLQAVDEAYHKGLRSLMLTYNLMDNVGTGCTERVDAGLSIFGIDVVRRCNSLGMIVDVSHCGLETTLDACRHSTRPVNANHAAAKSVHRHARGKTDEALRAIADTGGVIGIVAVPAFLTAHRSPSIEHMLDHFDHIASLVGWRHVAIGTDWPMQAPSDVVRKTLGADGASLGFREEDRLDFLQRLDGFRDGRDLLNITRGLVARDYSDEQVRGVLGENALRVFEEVCG